MLKAHGLLGRDLSPATPWFFRATRPSQKDRLRSTGDQWQK
ncbi:rCG27232 [Rattus norvegicus]|uniref:RCG27232 n=1 Tax=Rattus norvegicus TaxID=10116 RepID=A6HML5_RAT|nr:rCG27232 [Rattus norvegicus]